MSINNYPNQPMMTAVGAGNFYGAGGASVVQQTDSLRAVPMCKSSSDQQVKYIFTVK